MNTKVLSTRLPEDLYNAVEEVSKLRKRKRNEIVTEAVQLYIENYAEYKLAIDRLNDHTDEILNESDFMDELGWDS